MQDTVKNIQNIKRVTVLQWQKYCFLEGNYGIFFEGKKLTDSQIKQTHFFFCKYFILIF